MVRILIVYSSTHGHTAKVAAALAATLRRQAATVDIFDAATTACRPDEYHGVIVAASVHGGAYQPSVQQWTRLHAAVLNRKPGAFVSVCLGILQREDQKVQRDLADIVSRFTQAAGWTPTVVKPVAGALLYTRYNWFLRRMMKRIVAKAGGDTDTTRDYEYTDWDDVRAFAEQFGKLVAAASVPVPEAVSA